MTCYFPIKAWRSRSGRNENGSWPIVFKKVAGYADMELTVPCSRCIGCRLERSRIWASRIMHENQLHEESCFLTLTYDDKNLPHNNNLDKSALQKFFKRLRKKIGKVRYFACGEYGDQLGRPHYHVILFGHAFSDDRTLYAVRNGNRLYNSETLQGLWNRGHCVIGDVSFESAAYTARYIMKKQLGLPDELKDCVIDYDTGEILFEREPEFVTMSRRPGIARDWYEKYKGDVYPHDEVIVRGDVKCRPSRYYDKLYDIEYPKKFKAIKARRAERASKLDDDYKRLEVKEILKRRQINRLKRNYE
jgi:hypothetical protein